MKIIGTKEKGYQKVSSFEKPEKANKKKAKEEKDKEKPAEGENNETN